MTTATATDTRHGTTDAAHSRPDWRHDAECAKPGYDPEDWFPVGETGLGLLQTREAKNVCARCPVIEQCRKWAMETRQVFGVWGGLSPDERRALAPAYKKAQRSVTVEEEPLLDEWLAGGSPSLSKEQILRAIARGVDRGMSYGEIDRARGHTSQWASTFVSRMRKQYQAELREHEFPVKVQAPTPLLTAKTVRKMREEYAAGGVTDLDLALRYGVQRKVVSSAVSGLTYKNAGGPIREVMSPAAMAASREMKKAANAVAFMPKSGTKSNSKKTMGKVA